MLYDYNKLEMQRTQRVNELQEKVNQLQNYMFKNTYELNLKINVLLGNHCCFQKTKNNSDYYIVEAILIDDDFFEYRIICEYAKLKKHFIVINMRVEKCWEK